MSVQVRDNPDKSRYELFADGDLAGFARYRLDDGRMTLFHTEVDPAREGSGLGGALARGALDDARGRELVLVPTCPFIAGYIRRHPDEYLDIVVPEMRERVINGGKSG
jgi:predicted GNAT family acetyltransferase